MHLEEKTRPTHPEVSEQLLSILDRMTVHYHERT